MWRHLLAAGLIYGACSSAIPPRPAVIVEVQAEEPKHTLVERILRDEKRAAEVVRQTMTLSNDQELAALAAVYANRLGIQHDTTQSTKDITNGIHSENSLLAALCWRWLAVQDPPPCQHLQVSEPPLDDPVVAVLASAVYGRCGPLPEKLRERWGLPTGPPKANRSPKETDRRRDYLLTIAAPFDNGPLALALAFVEAQREEWGENLEPDATRFVADRFRAELFRLLISTNQELVSQLANSTPPGEVGLSAIYQYLETPLNAQNRHALYAAVLQGQPSLKVAALRALATVAREPLAEDFGAAASYLNADDPLLKLEAARTFLLLSKRAR